MRDYTILAELVTSGIERELFGGELDGSGAGERPAGKHGEMSLASEVGEGGSVLSGRGLRPRWTAIRMHMQRWITRMLPARP